MTSLSHQSLTDHLARLADFRKQPVPAQPAVPRAAQSRRRRFGSVGDAVVDVLAAAGTDVRFIDVHVEVERLLGEPVARSSVKNYLRNGGDGRRGVSIERVARGRYRLA